MLCAEPAALTCEYDDASPLFWRSCWLAAAVALAVVLRKHAPPEAARLLPGADGFVYIGLQWMRSRQYHGQSPRGSARSGLRAVHPGNRLSVRARPRRSRAGHPLPAEPDIVQQPRFSEVFVGKIDGERLRATSRHISNSSKITRPATSTASHSRDARYALPSSASTLSAASNLDDPHVIHGIVDRSASWHRHSAGRPCCVSITRKSPSPASPGPSSKCNPRATFPLPGRLDGHFSFRNQRPL